MSQKQSLKMCLLRHQNLFYRDFMLLESKGKVYLLIIFIFSSVVVFFDFCLSSILPKGNFRRLNAHTTILFVRVVVKPFFIDVVQILLRKSLDKYLLAMEVLHEKAKLKTIYLICSFIDIVCSFIYSEKC